MSLTIQRKLAMAVIFLGALAVSLGMSARPAEAYTQYAYYGTTAMPAYSSTGATGILERREWNRVYRPKGYPFYLCYYSWTGSATCSAINSGSNPFTHWLVAPNHRVGCANVYTGGGSIYPTTCKSTHP